MAYDKSGVLERLRKAGIDTSKIPEKALDVIGEMSDEELKQLGEIHKKYGARVESAASDTGGIIF